jgi:hypothetical protein
LGEAPAEFPCLTPGCDGSARSRWGRHAYCRPCQVRRGTRSADGRSVSGLIPTAPGSRTGRDHGGVGPIQRRAFKVVQAAQRIDHAIAREPGLKADLADALEAWHRQHRELVAAARLLDQELRRREKLGAELERGLAEWYAALEQLPNLKPGRR